MFPRRHLAFSRVAALVIAVTAAACGGGDGPSQPPAPVVRTVVVTPDPANIVLGSGVQLTASARDASGVAIAGKTAVWASGNNAIATVSGSGFVQGNQLGTAQVQATIDGVVGSATVNVTPIPVASIDVTPGTPNVNVGSTIQLTAVARDLNGNAMPGRTITWSSATTSVATVDGTGLVRGLTAGTAQITATSEGVSRTVNVTVLSPIGITTLTPATITAGSTINITGEGFSATAASNTVTLGGFTLPVTAATATSLTATVPADICLPTGNAEVRVSVAFGGTTQRNHPFQTSVTPINVALGQQVTISNPAQFCLQFPANASNEQYLIGVQSVSEVASGLTGVTVKSTIPAGVPGSTIETPLARTVTNARTISPVETTKSPSALRWQKHREAEFALRQRERQMTNNLLPLLARAPARSLVSAPPVPATTKLGDSITIKFPNVAGNLCANPSNLRVVVRHVGERAYWVEDIANPAGGFSVTDFQNMGNQLDQRIWASNVNYFGEPTDNDANAKLVIVISKEVNKAANLLGFVSSGDLRPLNICPASNEGEFYYGLAPDPTGIYALGQYSLSDALGDAPKLIAHEFTHVIQLGRRIARNGQSTTTQSQWELEGQATFAEEVAGHAVTGNVPGSNYGFPIAWNEPAVQPVFWYQDLFVYLAYYYGVASQTTKVTGAPEECAWLANSAGSNIGPCLGGGNVYGVSWSFLRWLSDQFGPTFTGGEAGLHRAMIDNNNSGFNNIQTVIGQPIDQLLMQWSAALYVDDRVANPAARLRFTSWNMQNIYNSLIVPARLVPRDRSFTNFTDGISVRAASTAYFNVTGANRPATAISVSGTGGLPGSMRLWVVRMQ